MKPRSEKEFLNIIKTAIKKNPAAPVRLDVQPDEHGAIYKVGQSLRMPYKMTCHISPAAQESGSVRWAFFPPTYQRPTPTMSIPLEPGTGTLFDDLVEQAEILQKEWGPEYHVAINEGGFSEEDDPQFYSVEHPARETSNKCASIHEERWACCEVWRGEDWLASIHEAFYPAEVAMCLLENIRELSQQKPDAARGRKQKADCRNISMKGGKATAHYTDTQVTQAFTEYKKRNPKNNAWAAAEALIREGQPLDEWHHVNSAWNRIGRIAEKQDGITREEWYNGL